MTMIPFLKPNLDLSTFGERLSELTVGWYSNFGPVETRYCDAMREQFFHPDHHIVGVNNATVGLSVALRMVDEAFHDTPAEIVLCPSFTFAATGLAALSIGKKVVFYDLDRQFQPDLDQILGFMDAQAGAPVSLILYETFGNQIDPAILDRLHDKGIPYVLDCAASLTLPSNHKTRRPKCIQVFSTHATKPFPTIEGGLIVCNGDELDLLQIRSYLNFGFRGSRSAQVNATNGKLGEMHSLVGLGTVERFPALMRSYHERANRYRERLQDILAPMPQHGHEPAYQFFPCLLKDGLPAKDIIETLTNQEEFGTGRYFVPCLHEQPAFSEATCAGPLNGTQWLADHIIALPLYSSLSMQDVDRICDRVLEAADARMSVV
ncbi:DegT/DnrJ/EryC1/StrS aminotransferase family protein [Aliiroseovarius crassostreae]|uniref:DegT/DnrJ/EryC1/StrS aminotransferase family protein n=1 Tax=Aliiroseovarius crassostreae TaxID=154981 RepID=UPI0021FF8989|nr:DegT/DnrJ/EryC1/StrS aminotransferase family protein [Aliiroseovarius crassostreae]UWQ06598.1 DegT/DnrJ/EryC1/StrS aminotransferase family protein [Aliiroseovarius crassostreae]UWQ09665.1 DegT/DnrJ/EryC1/StrS aminotransferase family protein [Aliiroseovarius crassostreae]